MEPTECRSEAEHLLAFLDPMHDYICWLADGLNPYDSAAQMRVIRRIAVVGGKAGTRCVTSAEGQYLLQAYRLEGLKERSAWSVRRPASRGSAQHRANERANLCQSAASINQLRIEQMPRMDHVRPHLQSYLDTSRPRHTGEPDRIV